MSYWAKKDGYHGRQKTNSILRCHLTKFDSSKRESHDIETRDGNDYSEVDLLLPAGFSVGTQSGDKSEGLFLEVNGDPVGGVVFPIGDTGTRLKVKSGEVAISKPGKPEIHFLIKDNGDIEVQTDANITYKAQNHIFEGDMQVKGKVKIDETLLVDKKITGDGGIDINGNVSATGSLDITGNISNGGNMTTGGVHNDAIGNHGA